jgi:hypothetical protein
MDLVREGSLTEGGQLMDRPWRRVLAIGAGAAATVAGSVAVASGDDGGGRNSNIRETLRHSSLYQGGEIRAQLGEHVH